MTAPTQQIGTYTDPSGYTATLNQPAKEFAMIPGEPLMALTITTPDNTGGLHHYITLPELDALAGLLHSSAAVLDELRQIRYRVRPGEVWELDVEGARVNALVDHKGRFTYTLPSGSTTMTAPIGSSLIRAGRKVLSVGGAA